MKLFIILISLFIGQALAGGFSLKTSSFDIKKHMPMKHVYNGFGCTGENVLPALEWFNAPKGTKSFAITVYDPDAPTGSGWWHWTIANIPSSVTSIHEGATDKSLPQGVVEGRTDYGKPGYGGPCPPPGKPHRYIFTVYALKTDKLEVNSESSGALMGFNINANTIDKASFTVKFGR